jgi:hypothetical protein
MKFSLRARRIHEHIVESGTAADWIKAAGAATKRGKLGGWFGEPQHKLDFPALTTKLKTELGGPFPETTDGDWREVADWLFQSALALKTR